MATANIATHMTKTNSDQNLPWELLHTDMRRLLSLCLLFTGDAVRMLDISLAVC